MTFLKKATALVFLAGSSGIVCAAPARHAKEHHRLSTPERTLTSDNDSFYRDEFTDCTACVENGHGWVGGRGDGGPCMASCDLIFDVSCYSKEYIPNQNTNQICEAANTEKMDWDICDPHADCQSCTSTPLSDGNENCYWYSETLSCQPVLVEPFLVGILPQGKDTCEPQEIECAAAGTDCNSCMENGCSWFHRWDGDYCLPSCTPGDEYCYNRENFTIPVDEICKIAADSIADNDLCVWKEDCSSCTSAIKSDGNPCQWYYDDLDDFGWCDTGVRETSLPASETCNPPTTGACGRMTSCLNCLNNENGCAWVEGSCQDTCDSIADATCYSAEIFPVWSSYEICTKERDDYKDQTFCSLFSDSCEDCTAATKLDWSPCSWYTDEKNNSWCGAGGCDMNGNCGLSDSKMCAAKSTSNKAGSVRGAIRGSMDLFP